MSRLPVVSVLAAAAIAITPQEAPASHARCFGVPTTLDGTKGDDRIVGTPAADVVASFGGNDTIAGRSGNDRLCAGPGHDVLLDGPGSDLIDGGRGVDVLYLCPDAALDRWWNVERVVPSTWACG